MRPSKTPSCQLVIPSFSSGNFSSAWFYLTSKTEVLLFQSIGVFFSVATGYSIQLFLSPILFLSFTCIYPNKLGAILTAIISLHFCSYIVEGFSSLQYCHSQPAQNHPSSGEKKALSRYFGFPRTKTIVQFIFFSTEKITDLWLSA